MSTRVGRSNNLSPNFAGSAVSLEFRQDHSQGALMTSLPTAGYILSHDAIFVRLNGTLAQSVVDFTFSDDPSRSTRELH